MGMSLSVRKLKEMYKLTFKRHEEERTGMIATFSFLAIAIIFALLAQSFSVNAPIWTQPPLIHFLYAIEGFLLLIAAVFGIRTKLVSFEKKIFLKIFEGYEHLVGFLYSQDESELNKATNLLHKVSLKLLARKEKAGLFDLMKEVDERYFKLGKVIQTKILFYIQNKKELGLIREKVLELADTFADANFNRLDSCITSIETIPEAGVFKPTPTFLEAKPRLRSLLVLLGKFFVSAISVTAFAVGLSIVFSKPLSEFATFILTITFALFIAWEFKSK